MLSRLLAGLALLVFVPAAMALEQRLKVEGVWDGETFQVERVKLRNAGKDPARIRISGDVWRMSFAERRLLIGPVSLNWAVSQDADISSVGLGDTLEVDAVRNSFGAFSIVAWKRVELESPDSLELIGAVTGSASDADASELFLAGIPTVTPRRLYSNGRMRLHRQDDRRPADQIVIELGSVRATIGGEVELEAQAEGDHDLDRRADDHVVDAEQQIQLEAFFEIGESVSAFAELKLARAQEFDFGSDSDNVETRFRRGETWVYFDRILGLPAALQIGRQNFAEDREWWWDTDLDAIRVYVNTDNLNIELAMAEELAPVEFGAADVDPEDDDIFRLLGRASFRINTALMVDLFYLYQNDHSAALQRNAILPESAEDEDDAELAWTGLRLSGEFGATALARVEYWLDLAHVNGTETHYEFDDFGDNEIIVESVTRQDRSGWAFDGGASFMFPDASFGVFDRPTLTFSYAYGSGADSADGTFRPTGINDNNGKFNGVDRFRYYGELSRPELSNLRIVTAALGFRFGDENSLELVYHDYQQAQAAVEHSMRIDTDANGLSRELGSEIDLIIGLEGWEHWEMEVGGAYFMPGTAFSVADPAWLFTFKLNYNF